MLAGVVSVPVGLSTLAYPPAVDPGVHVAVAIVLVIAHLLKAHGFVGLSRLEGGGRLVQGSMLVAALGFVALAICEGVSGWLVGGADRFTPRPSTSTTATVPARCWRPWRR